MLPSPIVSSGSILALWFTTDFAVSAQGFKAVYEGKAACAAACDACRGPLMDSLHLGRKATAAWWEKKRAKQNHEKFKLMVALNEKQPNVSASCWNGCCWIFTDNNSSLAGFFFII